MDVLLHPFRKYYSLRSTLPGVEDVYLLWYICGFPLDTMQHPVTQLCAHLTIQQALP